MDIGKLNIGLTYQLYLLFFFKNQHLLPFYLFLTAVLIIISLFDFPVLFADMVFSLSNIYLVIIFFSDNQQSFILYRKIFSITELHRLLVRISILFVLFAMQVIILLYAGLSVPPEVLSFYAIFVTSMLCVLLFMNELKNTWLKITLYSVSVVILLVLYVGILNLRESLIFSFSLFVVTILYSVIKLNHEANNYF